MRSRDGGDLDQAPGEGSKNTLLLDAQIADLRIHVEKVHFNTWITLKYFNDRCGTGIEGSDCNRAYQEHPGEPRAREV